MNEEIFTLRKRLKNKLDPMRYEHSVSVSFTCVALAMRYGYDLEKAELAGLMHDCGKRCSEAEIIKRCEKNSIPLTEDEKKAAAVLHAKYGAWLAEQKYGIADRELLNAILYHTTGRADMTLLEKIVYVADYIEVRRYKARNLREMRELAFINIDEALYQIIKGTIEYLQAKGNFINKETLEAFAFYQKNREVS